MRSETGTNPSKWGFVGLLGYMKDLANLFYVRARYYKPNQTQWLTEDALFPKERAYQYAAAAPTCYVDASGFQVKLPPGSTYDPISPLTCCSKQAGPAMAAANKFCKDFGLGTNQDGTLCDAMRHCMWACLVTQNCGEINNQTGAQIALECTDRHEEDTPWWVPNFSCLHNLGYRPVPDPYKPNPTDQKCMDLYNNRVGINCASAQDCYSCCLQNIKSGGVQIIVGPPRLPPGFRKPKTDCKHNPGKVILPSIR